MPERVDNKSIDRRAAERIFHSWYALSIYRSSLKAWAEKRDNQETNFQIQKLIGALKKQIQKCGGVDAVNDSLKLLGSSLSLPGLKDKTEDWSWLPENLRPTK